MKTRFLLLLIFLIVLLFSSCVKTGHNELVICSFGGTFQEAQRKAFFEPFEKETGIKVIEVSYSGSYSKIKALVKSGNVEWDLVDVEYGVYLSGVREKVFEKFDYSKIDTMNIYTSAIFDYGIATDFYSTGIGYRFNTKKHLNNWIEFWDIKNNPGIRSLRNNPYTTLESALLADGVSPDSLYPLDVERAFESLNKIKDQINVWWSTGQQPVQLLATNEVDYTSVWSGRIWNAKHINNLDLNFNYNQALLEPELWVILKGSKNKANALKFINFASQAKQQAKLSELFGVGPINKNAFNYMDKDLIEELPTHPKNINKQILINGEWWADNQEEVQTKWEKWIIE